ncbi:MAG: ATP-binding cassette domain-containing protein [Scytonematopsis contorta HA4267-MV1]|jgi:putative ATP-binding cassette transporter|nr:ATP-binding cassette domain-containing protein [Scytonematopsis contorta HA4267-MV1]
MNIFDNQLWKQFLALAKPYWYPDEEGRSWREILFSWFLLVLSLLLLVTITSVNAFNSYATRDLIDLLEQKNTSNYFNLLITYAISLATLAILIVFSQYLRRKIALDWYQHLTKYILEKYFGNLAYYKISLKSEIDYPDQRISQEIEPIPRMAMNLLFVFLEKAMEMVTFIVILWSISKLVAVIMVVYTIVGNAVGLYFNQELNKINSKETEGQANFNYCLTHVHKNAESIAFFQGESRESNIIKRAFTNLIQNRQQLTGWQNNQLLFTNGYQFFIILLPFILIGPLYFFDEIELGEVNQASVGCAIFAGALSVIVSELAYAGQLTNLINRLSTFLEALSASSTQQEVDNIIETVEAENIAVENVTLQTPNYEQVLVRDLSFSVETSTGMVIVGSSGTGKSSLLRAIAGLWKSGTGRIVRPNLEEILFLPQNPYLILGTLREQLLYPNRNNQITDSELEEILQQVNLHYLLTRVGSFDTEQYWENVLSLGEQQRLIFARVLVTRPRYVIIDEATSALDLENEDNLYQLLQQTEATFISVGHRESLLKYHQWILELTGESNWELRPNNI